MQRPEGVKSCVSEELKVAPTLGAWGEGEVNGKESHPLENSKSFSNKGCREASTKSFGDRSHLKLKNAVQLFVHKYETIIAGSTFIPISPCNHGDTAPRLEKSHRTCVCGKASCCNSGFERSAERRGWKYSILKPQNMQCLLFYAFSFGVININCSFHSYHNIFFTPSENKMRIGLTQDVILYNFIYFIIMPRVYIKSEILLCCYL